MDPQVHADPGFAGFIDRVLPGQADIGKQSVVEFEKLPPLVPLLVTAADFG
jgi:hypothetical protein